MSVKKIIKNILGYIRCSLAGVAYPQGGVYIGRNVHFANGKNIKLGKQVQIRPDVDLFAGEIFQIGNGCDIGTRNRINGNVVIEENVLLGPDNYISSEDHCYENITLPIMEQGTYFVHNNGHGELKIGADSWIGTHVAIIGDVRIGKHCVIGANSVVVKDVPDFSVVVGIPGRVVKTYDQKEGKWVKV